MWYVPMYLAIEKPLFYFSDEPNGPDKYVENDDYFISNNYIYSSIVSVTNITTYIKVRR